MSSGELHPSERNLTEVRRALQQIRIKLRLLDSIVPIGAIIAFAGVEIPDGFTECDGSEHSRTGEPELFGAIGTTYGIGDGATTFLVPDYRGLSLVGVGAIPGLATVSLGGTVGASTVEEIPLSEDISD